jgi:hypothetical protein
MAGRFTGIPALPQSGVDEWNARLLDALKQNVELLTGTRGEVDGASMALLKSSITTSQVTDYNFRGLTAKGAGFNITNVGQVPAYTDYASLLQDVASLARDVAQLRATVNSLINQLRA